MHKNNIFRFDRLFRACRTELGISQKEMSEKLKITQGHLSHIEQRRSLPNSDILLRLLIVTAEIENPDLYNRFRTGSY